MVARRLGIAIGRGTIHVLCRGRRSQLWAAEASYDSHEDLAEALASLLGQRPPGAQRARVALSGDTAECKVIESMPRMTDRELKDHLRLHVRRYFVSEAAALIVSGAALQSRGGTTVSCIAGAPLELIQAIHHGLANAAISVEAIAPSMCWPGPLDRAMWETEPLGERSAPFMAAAMTLVSRRPFLTLESPGDEAQSARRARRQTAVAAIWAIAVLMAALLLRETRLVLAVERAEAEITRMSPAVERIRSLRASSDSLEEALVFLRASLRASDRTRSLAALARVLPDSTFLTRLELGHGAEMNVSLVSRNAASAIRSLRREPSLASLGLDGPIVRERTADTDWERFSMRAPGTQ